MGEYAILVSALAVMLSGPGGTAADLPRTIARADTRVAESAARIGVAPGSAKRAVKSAPTAFRRAPLRYLYGLGWISAKKDTITCGLIRLSGGGVKDVVRRQFRRVKGMAAALRRARVTETQAVNAFDAGFRAGCA